MRCGCPQCGTYMIQSEGIDFGCVCPECLYRCRACMGTNTVVSREDLRSLTFVDHTAEHEMEKVLFACDELTGLIGACAKMRPSGSIADMDLKSLKKKYKSKGFAAGCSREVIAQGAEMLGWTLDDLLSRTLEVMKPDEAAIAAAVAAL